MAVQYARDGISIGTGGKSSLASLDTLSAVHPLYRRHAPFWEKAIDFAEGENLRRYVPKHPRESQRAYEARLRFLPYRNFVDPILSLNVSYLFSKPVTRDAEPQPESGRARDRETMPGGRLARLADRRQRQRERLKPPSRDHIEEWKQFQYDVDRQGNTSDRFMRRRAYEALLLGMTHVLVDLPRADRQPVSRRDRQDMGLLPYFASYLPTDLVNWEVDGDNRYKWVRFREAVTDDVNPFDRRVQDTDQARLEQALLAIEQPHDPMRLAAGRSHTLYRTFTQEEWFLDEVQRGTVKRVDSGSHNLGVVPVVTIFNRQKLKFPIIGRSEVHDIISLNQEILHQDTCLSEAFDQQLLNLLVMKKQANTKKQYVIGASNILTYTGDQAPFFISPSTAPVGAMEARIQGLIGEIYRLARFSGRQGLDVQGFQSGVAATVEFNQADRALAEKAEELQNAEWQLHYLWFLYLRQRFDGTIDYPDSFQVQSYSEELQQLTAAKQALRSDRCIRELEKRAVRRLLPNVPQATLDEIEFEIDVIPPSIQSFSGPVWFDPVTQQIRQPTDTDKPPIGVLGELYARLAEEEGVDLEGIAQQQNMPPEMMQPSPEVPPEKAQAARKKPASERVGEHAGRAVGKAKRASAAEKKKAA